MCTNIAQKGHPRAYFGILSATEMHCCRIIRVDDWTKAQSPCHEPTTGVIPEIRAKRDSGKCSSCSQGEETRDFCHINPLSAFLATIPTVKTSSANKNSICHWCHGVNPLFHREHEWPAAEPSLQATSMLAVPHATHGWQVAFRQNAGTAERLIEKHELIVNNTDYQPTRCGRNCRSIIELILSTRAIGALTTWEIDEQLATTPDHEVIVFQWPAPPHVKNH